ncbi:divalent-cation tolerance protein CutA [Maricaulis sp.]|uniref:divalent-cation tolerance protein CutA n=1 Tax=Maricaulis sp. TaxID=1486257 RepID=UPI003A8EAADC
MDRVCLIYTCWPDTASAEAAAARLLDENLCACVNILPGMVSLYRWQGKVERAGECIALFKTTTQAAPMLTQRLVDLHPYDEPAILCFPVDGELSASGFVDWIATQAGSA